MQGFGDRVLGDLNLGDWSLEQVLAFPVLVSPSPASPALALPIPLTSHPESEIHAAQVLVTYASGVMAGEPGKQAEAVAAAALGYESAR